VLNVRSAAADDRTTRARIRDAAVQRFGREGFGVPVRAIAQDAGVSAALVIHHFGSKGGLRAETDAHVLRVLREVETESLMAAAPGEFLTRLATVEEFGPVTGYVVQALLAGGELATAFLDSMVRDAEIYLADAVEAGRIRPSRNPAQRARYLAYLGLGGLLVHLRQLPPGEDVGAALRSYADAFVLPALELYSEGLFSDSTLLDAYLDQRPGPSGPPS
jgi:AcrR family transcriptional regulator